jgi:Fanconi anemia group I protein
MDSSLSLPLMRAVHPILFMNSSFKDHVILVLRKSIFASELQSRLTAVTGFLFILQHMPEGNEDLGHEILGNIVSTQC